MHTDFKAKTLKELLPIVKALRKKGKRVAFTNGCFDILHYGHVKYLEDSKVRADVLVVAINSDSSVRKIKGKRRPINKQLDRARVLCALSCVDYLTIFSEITPLKLIKYIKPDFLIKGGDWEKGTIVGSDFVKSYGGKTVVIPYIKGYSTTSLIKKCVSLKLNE